MAGTRLFRIGCSVDGTPVSIYSFLEFERGAMGPFQTPWLTFFAWIVIGGTVLMAIVWSIWGFRKGEDR